MTEAIELRTELLDLQDKIITGLRRAGALFAFLSDADERSSKPEHLTAGEMGAEIVEDLQAATDRLFDILPDPEREAFIAQMRELGEGSSKN